MLELKQDVKDITPISIAMSKINIDEKTEAKAFGYGSILPQETGDVWGELQQRETNQPKDTMVNELQVANLPIIKRTKALWWMTRRMSYGLDAYEQQKEHAKGIWGFLTRAKDGLKDFRHQLLGAAIQQRIPSKGLLFAGSDKNVSTCSGDRGGPLVVSKNGQDVQIGVLSYGYFGCGHTHSPSIYIDLREHIEWLEEHTAIKKETEEVDRDSSIISEPTFDGIKL
jgi:hypothetical protein